MRTSNEIREGFLSYFEEQGHLRRPSASLIPRADDRSTLLVTAGMQPQMPYFLGREPPPRRAHDALAEVSSAPSTSTTSASTPII